jgi:hypothetical protein
MRGRVMLTDEGLVQRGRGRSRGRALPLGLWMREPLRLAFVLEVPAGVGLLTRPRWPPALLQKGSTKKIKKKANTCDEIRTAQGCRGRRRGLPGGEVRRARHPLGWGWI